ncbi:unnamed protein product [Moneuplotes crassus]|uniref:Enoyl reductase (ER) domain-containing protein n=1 Tax=Euplotes crassus TaxID=5936 RepID=A0AAD1XKT9_EUPCR|nr:unnamed protein product [Moneuplotes crassus]
MESSLKIKAIIAEEQGAPDVFKVGEVDFPSNEGKENYVWIKTEATGINRAETMQRKGLYPSIPGETDVIGLEAAGYLVNSQEEYTSGEYKNNERVMALLPGGGYSDIARVHKDHLMKIPENLSFEEGAAIPETWLTSFQLLFLVASGKEGQTALIHAAGSGIGCAAIQLCKKVGITTIAVASTNEKLELAKSIGASHGINYKENADFSTLVQEYTGGKGVNIILDCVGAQNFDYNIKSAAVDCQWVLYGLMGGPKVPEFNLKSFMGKRIQLLCSTLKTRTNEYKADMITKFSEQFLPLFETGELKPIIDITLKYSEMKDAHEYMESNKTQGKIICTNDL